MAKGPLHILRSVVFEAYRDLSEALQKVTESCAECHSPQKPVSKTQDHVTQLPHITSPNNNITQRTQGVRTPDQHHVLQGHLQDCRDMLQVP